MSEEHFYWVCKHCGERNADKEYQCASCDKWFDGL